MGEVMDRREALKRKVSSRCVLCVGCFVVVFVLERTDGRDRVCLWTDGGVYVHCSCTWRTYLVHRRLALPDGVDEGGPRLVGGQEGRRQRPVVASGRLRELDLACRFRGGVNGWSGVMVSRRAQACLAVAVHHQIRRWHKRYAPLPICSKGLPTGPAFAFASVPLASFSSSGLPFFFLLAGAAAAAEAEATAAPVSSEGGKGRENGRRATGCGSQWKPTT